ncbi:HAD-IC family P-type ATPase [Streptomyces sp. ACA25]|uniref:HAD-IC family P-type ATPase n=1 Tax=Streptomyces sp. ACA25 TaxID=3022596 RepID=UPI0023074D69|nr:HAD-IC family P-type ATPase [Streptomyces sp. ACA25]MDB1088254.1 HAD-IC family P-type ATPase [Streptomyces sp. ACA25]
MTDQKALREEQRAAHELSAEAAVRQLGTDVHQGLSSAEAEQRLEQYGPNVLPQAGTTGPLKRLLLQFHNPLIYVLLVAAAVALAIGETVDSAVILGVVLANAAIGYVQESKAESALDALRAMVRTQARVVRDGAAREVDSETLVPGDVVLIQSGDKVPADVRLLRLAELRVDESALTGESDPVSKENVALPAETVVADRRNMAYSGALVTSGNGTGVVVATGSGTELGEIHRLVGSAQMLATPLTRKLSAFSKVLTFAILALAAFAFVVGLARGDDAALTFTAAVALAVAAIPEGLPAVVTITLAIGVSRMARRHAVIRRLPCVETLGSTTVICSDKTGTLTQNEMTVHTVWTPDGSFRATGTGYAPHGELQDLDGRPLGRHGSDSGWEGGEALHWTLLIGAACNDARLTEHEESWHLVGDPTEGALLASAHKAGLTPRYMNRHLPRVDTVPFSSKRRRMATLHRDRVPHGEQAADRTVTLVKGAVEGLLPACDREMAADGTLRPLDREAVEEALHELAAKGLRVLATGLRREPGSAETLSEDSLDEGFVLTGLQAMFDPPREAAKESIRACHTAGIDVKMITGDHVATAKAIATRLGLPTDRENAVVSGAELSELPPDEYRETLRGATVLARVSPEQKLRMVEALQADEQVVAMTGDGVNDAPALRQADIGVAMGHSGTEVAKEASDAILLDDNFATIEAAVEEGRGVFDNLSKFIVWILPTNMGQGLVILTAIVLGSALPVLPTQILWVNMTTAVLLGLMLAFEPRERGIMERPPRSPAQPLLTWGLALRIFLVGILIVAAATWLFEWERTNGGVSEEAARTSAMNVIIAIQVFYLFSCRSLTRSAWRTGFFSNPWIFLGVGLQVLAQLAITYIPVMNTLFQTEPLSLEAWLRILALAAAASVIIALDKHLRRNMT